MNKPSNEIWNNYTNKYITEQIGRFIQQQRIHQNKSQNDISQLAGISRSTLSLMERGEASSINSLLQVLRALNKLDLLQCFQTQPELTPLNYQKTQNHYKKRARGRSKENQQNLEDLNYQ